MPSLWTTTSPQDTSSRRGLSFFSLFFFFFVKLIVVFRAKRFVSFGHWVDRWKSLDHCEHLFESLFGEKELLQASRAARRIEGSFFLCAPLRLRSVSLTICTHLLAKRTNRPATVNRHIRASLIDTYRASWILSLISGPSIVLVHPSHHRSNILILNVY